MSDPISDALYSINRTLYEISCFFQDMDNSLILTESNVARHEYTDSELNRIDEIRAELKRLRDDLPKQTDSAKISAMVGEINSLDRELHRIMCSWPGIIPQTLTSVNSTITQFHEIEQPKIEVIMDSVNNTLRNAYAAIDKINTTSIPLANSILTEAHDGVMPKAENILEDADRLLLVRRTAAREESELSEEELTYLKDLRKRDQELKDMLKAKQDELDRLIASGAKDRQTLDRIDVLKWEMGNVQRAIDANYRETIDLLYTSPGVIPEMLYDIGQCIKRFNTVEQPRIEDIMDSADDSLDEARQTLSNVNKLFVTRTLEPVDPLTLLPALRERLDFLSGESKALEQKIKEQRDLITKIRAGKGLEEPPAPAIRDGGPSAPAAKIGGQPANGSAEMASLRYKEREMLWLGKELDKIRFRWVEKPGVIPETLESLHGSFGEAQGILAKINEATGKALGFACKLSLPIKIGLGISGVAIVVTLILIPLLLVRMILFGL